MKSPVNCVGCRTAYSRIQRLGMCSSDISLLEPNQVKLCDRVRTANLLTSQPRVRVMGGVLSSLADLSRPTTQSRPVSRSIAGRAKSAHDNSTLVISSPNLPSSSLHVIQPNNSPTRRTSPHDICLLQRNESKFNNRIITFRI